MLVKWKKGLGRKKIQEIRMFERKERKFHENQASATLMPNTSSEQGENSHNTV